ncbi:TonB-dependent receptor [Vibrio sp. ZSDZ65]|uniref:TonB-dependent receptor n=1 Tax=Vibrio qingdaonensis TaxID=2829491 RepID=A0A9X3CL75_9VIBR|nr:TonB-dependent receptor [Vibrio qingdaonensis]MCW8345448.1 TonB-dependent receptor [Vibrio qingdaonensis]
MTAKSSFLIHLSCLALASHTVASDDLMSLIDMPLASLAETKVVSTTRNAQSLADTPASVYVITAKEINRSGARSVADVLALAPGLHVAKFSNYDWGISARGSNQALNNSLLVMVDGRSVFNAMFSGVDWDLIPVSLDSIAQIEIVLGPVGTIWGGNAVNGVVNIITADAESAPQGKVSVSAGNYQYREVKLHEATQLNAKTHISGYVEYVEHMPWTSEEERVQTNQHFGVLTGRFGGRLDYQHLENTLNVQFGGIRSEEDYLWAKYNPHFLFPGKPSTEYFEQVMVAQEYFLGMNHVYERANADTWENDAWLTYSSNDSTDRNTQFARLDLDSRYTLNDVVGTQLMLGVNVRLIDEAFASYSLQDQFTMPYLRTTQSPEFFNQSYGLFANWTVPVTDRTTMMLGSRWQYDNITNRVAPQPQARFSYALSKSQRLWAGWGRAIVTPSRLELSTEFQQNGYIEGAQFSDGNKYDYFYSYVYKGNEDLAVESVETYELGYRFWNEDRLQLSVSGFYSQRDNIRVYKGVSSNQWVISDGSSPGTSGTVIEEYVSQYIDPLSTQSYGGEIAMKWQALENLQLNTNYSYKRIIGDCSGAICSTNNEVTYNLENQPNHFVNAQLMWDISANFWMSSMMQYIAPSVLHPDSNSETSARWPRVFNVEMALSWLPKVGYPRFTASVENLGANQTIEYPETFGAFQNGTQYWVTAEWDYAASLNR